MVNMAGSEHGFRYLLSRYYDAARLRQNLGMMTGYVASMIVTKSMRGFGLFALYRHQCRDTGGGTNRGVVVGLVISVYLCPPNW